MTDRDVPYKTHEEVMEKLLEDPEFRETYEELQPEYALKEAIVGARRCASWLRALGVRLEIGAEGL